MMAPRPRRQSGVANGGPRSKRSRRMRDRSRVLVLSGPLAWVERDGRAAVLRVRESNRRGRVLRGRTVTLELAAARVSAPDRDADGRRTPADLLPGEWVSVRVLWPGALREPPRTVAPRLVTAHDFSA